MSTSTYDLIVVGAGISGLWTSILFLRQYPNHRVLLLEARDRVGGRTFAKDIGGYMWDLGGQWLGVKQHRMYDLCRRYNLEIFDQYYEGKVVSIPFNDDDDDDNDQKDDDDDGDDGHGDPGQKRKLHIFGAVDESDSATTASDASASASASSVYPSHVDQYMRDIDLCVREIEQCEDKRREYDSMSAFEWKRQRYGIEVANELNTVQGLVAIDPKEVSFLYWLMYVRYGQGILFLSETNQGGQHHRVKGGSYLFSLNMYRELMDMRRRRGARCNVQLSSPVQSIDQQVLEHLNLVRVTTSTGQVFDASRVVVTIPPVLIANIHFSPELPRQKRVLYDNFPMGKVIKCLVFYDRPWWRTDNYSGISLTNNEKYGVRLTYDASLEFPENTQYALVAFFLGNGAKQWSNRTKEERLQHICDYFGHVFNNEREAQRSRVLNYAEMDWCKEPYSQGAYVGHLPPTILTRIGGEHVIRENVGKVHFAGTETATYFIGYLEGAVQSAERVVSELRACFDSRIIQVSKL